MSRHDGLDGHGDVEGLLNETGCDDRIDGKNCVFNSDEFVSKPIKSERCGIDENIIQLHHSFGYDCCSKMFNICAADDHTVVYAAGSYITMFDVNSGSLKFRKCAGNGGIGHITKNPVFNHLAVGENCNNPLIIVYEWPTFEIISVLRGSAKRHNNWLTYSKNGNYLCSQGGEPDNTLTIWDWKESKIVLRTKSHNQNVDICRFSNFMPDHLVTAGSGHVQFWKMANTFTGLKLQGRLGRFGKTEISDVVGIFSMPDEKVISGCKWGNILVWDEEIIDLQVMRKGRKPCHLAPIIMFLYSEHDMELTSVSMDGTIKFWYYRTVNTADPPENDRTLEMEPSFTINVQDSVGVAKIMGMCKVDENPDSFDYFIQDGNGGLWLADIRVAADMKPLKRLAKFHGDAITSLQASPIGYFIATVSLDGWFHVYDVANKKLIFTHNFKVPVTSLIWLPLKIASTGNMFVIGFQSGILKTVAVPMMDIMEDKSSKLIEIQSSKPHTSSIGHLTVNRSAKVLMSGSDDCSIFVYEILTEPIKLKPIGMYPLLGKINFIYWKPSEEQTALVCCSSGHIVEVDVPTSRPAYTKESFLLKLEPRVVKTVSMNSEVDRERLCKTGAERTAKEKTCKKTEELKTIKEKNLDMVIDENITRFEGSNEHGYPSERFVSSSPSPVLFAVYTPSEKTLWASIDGGHNAGYLYEYDLGKPGPVNATAIPGKNGVPLTAIETFGTDPLTVLMGFADGRIRVTNVHVDDLSDLSDYVEYSIHDNRSGKVKKLCFSQDNCMLYTYGDDGNIFSFIFQCNDSDIEKNSIPVSSFSKSPKLMKDDVLQTEEDLKLSLEERKVNKEKRKAMNLANQEKDKTSCILHGLKEKFNLVLKSNKSLPEPLQFSNDYFQFDERINRSLIEEAQSEMNKLHLKLAFDYEKSSLGLKKLKTYFVDRVLTTKFKVKAIKKDVEVKTIYHEVRHNLFSSLMEEFASRKHSKRQRRKSTVLEKSTGNQIHKVTESEIFLRNVREIYPSLPKKIQSAIDKFATRIDFENKEILKIKSMHNEKPNNTKAEEEAILDNAWETIGDFNLKTAPDFKPSNDKIISIEDKFQQYLHVRDEIYYLKSTFNKKVFDSKERKIKLIHEFKQFKFDVSEILNELESPEIPLDFPELLVDESIDPDLIDSFKPMRHLDPMELILNLKKSDLLNSKIYKNDFHENATHLETVMQKLRIEKLKYKHVCLHESMLAKINIFDDHLSTLEATRKDVKLRITFLELFALTLEEELLVLNDFDLVEDEYSYNVYLTTVKQNDKIDQIQTIREDITYLNKIIENKMNRLIDVQHTFDMEVRNDDFARHLRKIFKKRLRIPKVKSDDEDDDESLSSSSDESEFDSDPESVKNGSGESMTTMGRLAVFDENVLPEGCDEKLFALTFELRSQRHDIEQSIEKTKIKAELSNKSLSLAEAELFLIENELKKNICKLEEYQIEKQLKLNDVETTIVLNKSQTAKSRLLNNSILVYGNVMQVLTNRVTELKKEIDDIKDTYKGEKLLAKQLRTEINVMEHVLKKIKVAIRDEMIKKFRMETDWSFLDDMEMAIINCMIIQAKSNEEETKERFVKEVKLLENQIRAHQEMLTDLLGSNTVKTITLKGVREGIQQLQQCLAIQQKNSQKVLDLSVESSYTSDMATLKEVFNTLLKRKQDICKEIDSLKYKGKMFPPIAKQPCASAKPDQSSSVDRATVPRLSPATPSSAREETDDSWTIDHGDEEEEVYNIEFNVEPKVSASSKQSSSRLTKQSSHYDGFENIDEVCSYDGENDWTRYYDDEDGAGGVITGPADEDFAHSDVFPELITTEVGRNGVSADDEGSEGGYVGPNNRKQWDERANDNDSENGSRKSL